MERKKLLEYVGMGEYVDKSGLLIGLKYPENYLLLKGSVQSGKTGLMIRAALWNQWKGLSTVIVLRRSRSEKKQLLDRIRQFNDLGYGLKVGLGGVLVCLGTGSGLMGVLGVLRGVLGEYVVFVDECDVMDGGMDTKSGELLGVLKKGGSMTMGVSATVMDSLVRERIDRSRLIVMGKVDGYRGIETFVCKSMGSGVGLASNRVVDDPFVRDPGVKKFLRMVSRLEPFRLDYYGVDVPVMALMNIGKTRVPQKRVFDYGVRKYGDRVLFCLYSGDGVVLGGGGLGGESLVGDWGESVVVGVGGGFVHKLGEVYLPKVYQYLKENGGVSRYPRIVTIGGRLVGRGLAFTSLDYGKYVYESGLGFDRMRLSEIVVGWRTNYMYYVASEHTDQPELIQNAGRPCVVAPREDKVPITLVGPRETLSAVIKALYLQEDLVGQARELVGGSVGLSMGEALGQVAVYREKIAVGHRVCKRGGLRLNRVGDPEEDVGMEVGSYVYGDGKVGGFVVDVRRVVVGGDKLIEKYFGVSGSGVWVDSGVLLGGRRGIGKLRELWGKGERVEMEGEKGLLLKKRGKRVFVRVN